MLYFLLAAVLAALPGTPASTELAQVFAAGTAIGATMAISPIRASSTCSTSGRAGACRRPISRWRGKTTIYVTWRDKRGEQADVVPINFDPTAALAEEQKKLLEQFWTSLIAFREWQGMTVYFTHLVTYRCAIKEVRYGFGDVPVDKVFKLPHGASTRLNRGEVSPLATTCWVQTARIMLIWRSSNNYRKEVIQCLIVGRHWLISAVFLPKGNIAVTRKAS